MPLQGGTLNPRNITFLDSFLAHKGSQFLDPYVLYNALRKPPYNTRLTNLKLSFNDLKEYIRLVKSQGIKEIKQKLEAAEAAEAAAASGASAASGAPAPVPGVHKAAPKKKQTIIYDIVRPPPSPPGAFRKMASFLKDKIKKTFKKKSSPPVPPLLVPPPATAAVRAAPPPIGHIAPRVSSTSPHSPPSFRRHKDSKTRKHRRRGFATLSSDSGERLLRRKSASASPRTSSSPRTSTSTSTYTKTSSSSSSSPSSPPSKPGSPKVGTRGVDAREVARKLGHESREGSLTKSEKEEKLRTGAPAYYALAKGAKFVKEGTKKLALKGTAALFRKTGEAATYVGTKGPEVYRATTRKIGEKYREGKGKFNIWKEKRAEAKRLEALRKAAEPSPRAAAASSRPGFVSRMGAKFRGSRVVPAAAAVAVPPPAARAASSSPGFFSKMGAKFRGSRVVPAKAVGIRRPGLVRRSSSSSSSASSASRHSLASRASSASKHSSSSASSASSRSGSPSPRPPPRAGIAALAHAHGVVAHAPVRAGILSRVGARVKSAFTRNPAKAVGVRGPKLIKRSSSSASSRHSSKSSVGAVGAVAPASPKKGLGAWVGNLFSRKKQVTRKVRKSSSHSGLKRGLMAKGSYASSSSKKSSQSKLSSASASRASHASSASPASRHSASSRASSASRHSASSPKSSWSSSSGSPKAKPKIMVKIKSPGAKGAVALPVFFPGPPGFKSKGAAAKGAVVGGPVVASVKFGPAAAAAKLAPVILAPVVSDASSSASSISSADSVASAAPVIVVASPKAASSPKSSWSSSSGSPKAKPKIMVKIKSPGAKGAAAALPVFFPGPPGFKPKGAAAAAAAAAPVVVVASPKASAKAVSAAVAAAASLQASPMIDFDSPKAAAAKGASSVAASSASLQASPMIVLESPKGAKAGFSAVVGLSPRALAMQEALYPSSSASPKAASAKGASPKAVSAAKAAASAPIIVVPSPAAATSLPALRKLLADATEMLAVRKAIAVREALAARSARTNKLPSAAQKRIEALAARSNFREVKAMVEKLSARVAAASAPIVVVKAAKGISSKGAKEAAAKAVSAAASLQASPMINFDSPKAAAAVAPSPVVAVAPSPVAAAPVILNVSPRNKWSSSSDGSRKAKPKIKFSINPLAKAASPKAASLLGVSPKGNSPNSVNWDTNVLIQQDLPIGSQDWGESPKAASVEPLPPGWLGYMHPEPEVGAFYGKPEEDLGIWVRPKDRPVKVSAVPDEIAEFMKGQSKAHVVKGMRGQKSRKRSNPLLDLEKQLNDGLKKTKRLERYKRLIAEGRRREAIKYMRKHNMLHEVMDMSHVVPVEDIGLDVVNIDQPSPSSKKGAPLGLIAQIKESPVDLNLDVVNIDQLGTPSKKRSSSGSRKRASAKPSSSPHSRKVGKGASFGKMAEVLQKEAKQDAAFKPAQFKEPPKAKSTYVVGVRGAEAGKKGDKTVDALHKKVVNLAISPTFKPHDPKKGNWM